MEKNYNLENKGARLAWISSHHSITTIRHIFCFSQLATGTMATHQFEEKGEWEKQTSVRDSTCRALPLKGRTHEVYQREEVIGWGGFLGTYERAESRGMEFTDGCREAGWREDSQCEENDTSREESWCATECRAGLAEGAGSGMLIDHLRQRDSRQEENSDVVTVMIRYSPCATCAVLCCIWLHFHVNADGENGAITAHGEESLLYVGQLCVHKKQLGLIIFSLCWNKTQQN